MQTNNVRVDIVVEGITNNEEWVCGFEFDYPNEESFYCRPLRTSEGENLTRMPVPAAVSCVRVAFLPPMSGLAANETRLDQGATNVRLKRHLATVILFQVLSGEIRLEVRDPRGEALAPSAELVSDGEKAFVPIQPTRSTRWMTGEEMTVEGPTTKQLRRNGALNIGSYRETPRRIGGRATQQSL
ncbi:MAG TPA: hypothetical protein VJX67_05610 [Blastocatellia bacterium]|nr:hypothetical protein [Blastocatellia bacterium]